MAKLLRQDKYFAYDLSKVWQPVTKPDAMWWDF